MIAIQTPHGSHLNIFHQKKAEQHMAQLHQSGIRHNDSTEPMKDSYHLEIDAETGRAGLADENIKIYQVDAPDRFKKQNTQKSAMKDEP